VRAPGRALLLLCAAVAPGPVRAGVVAVTENGSERSILSVEGSRLRIETVAGGSTRVLVFDAAARKLTSIDPQARVFGEMTEADARVLSTKMREELDRAKALMTPEKRAEIEARLSTGPAAPEVRYLPTGKSQTIAGILCAGYEEVAGGERQSEGCYIPWEAGLVSRQDLEPLARLGEFLALLYSGVRGPLPAGGLTREIARSPGFPASRTPLGRDGQRGEEERLVRLERKPVPDSEFAVPAGFTRILQAPVGAR